MDIGPHRRYTFVDADLDQFKAIKNSLGGTLNDVVLASVSLALGRYLRREGVETDGLELKASERNIGFDLDLAADLPAVNGQDDELSQIFQNLLDNALKYAREGTRVEVTARPMDEWRSVTISVRDYGEGIERERGGDHRRTGA